MSCNVCGRKPGSRVPRCIRCAERGRDRMLPACLPGRYLVVDAASKSGWAQVTGTRSPVPHVDDLGQCSIWSPDPDEVCRRAVVDLCLAMVIEVPSPASLGVGGPTTILGIGKAVGIWQRAWELACRAGGRKGKGIVCVEVMTVSWRPVILGQHHGSDAWKAAALKHARATWPELEDRIVGEEIPDALCLAEYALCSLTLADAVGAKRLAELGWKEPRGAWVNGLFETDLPF